MSKRLFCAVVCCLFMSTTIAQINQNFILHLSENNLKTEHWTYLQQQLESDSTYYYKAKYHLQYGNDSAFISSVQNCIPLFLSDTLARDFSSNYFIDHSNPFRSTWFENILPKEAFETSGIPYIYYSSIHPREADLQLIPKRLQDDFLRFQKADRKSPLLAATFSAIIPGTGKLYIGNTRSFILTFVSMSVLGLQSWESYQHLGIKHPLSILNVSFFSFYYAVNVFGSFKATKDKRNEIRHQYLINASRHYSAFSPSSLY